MKLMLKTSSNKSDCGFTLVEVLISLFLVVVIIGINYQLLVVSTQTSVRAQRYIIADSVAFAKIQEYENLAFEDIPTGVASGGFEVEDFTSDIAIETENEITNGTGIVRSEEESGSLYKVTVEVTYPSIPGGNDTLVEYATYIQLGGVGR